MATKTVTKVEQTEKGTMYVCFDDEQTRYYVSRDISAPGLGTVIEADTSSKRFKNSKYDTWFLNSWTTPKVKTATEVKQEIAQKTLPPPVVNAGSWMIDYNQCAAFVSNVVAHAIEAKLINEPSDIHPWVSASYRAFQGLRMGKLVDFDDRIPFPDEPPKFNGDPGPDVEF